jgi:peptide chain release factor 2
LRRRLAGLEEESARPDLWNDKERAERVLREKRGVERELAFLSALAASLSDAGVLLELADEAGDEDTRAEAALKLASSERDLADAELRRLLGGDHDASNAILSINAGAGGTESQDWAEMLLRMYLRWCEKRGFRCDVTDVQAGEEAGIKSATVLVQGEYAYGNLAVEAGVHRLVRISPYDSASRRHTSFASVFAWPEIAEDIEIDIQEKDLRVDTYRSSGAGGQHVNVTDSAVRITHLPSGLVVSCQNERSQIRNRETAMKVLKARLYDLELQKQRERLDAVESSKKEIAFGSQIRSYVLHPYRMVKDLRTRHETGDVDRVLDGDLDDFIKATLVARAKGALAAAAQPDE